LRADTEKTVVEDPKWDLAILATVQGFYEKLLQDSVGGEVPVPVGLEAISLQDDGDIHQTVERMRRWLRLLDMAITPAMLRRAFVPDTDPEIAEALLRYLVRRKDASDVTRDKADLVCTFLYRHPRVPGQWEQRGYGLDGSLPLSPFEIALIEILADSDVPSLPEEHVQALREFDGLREEALQFNDLNTLLESRIITRVREIKQSLEMSFFHPGVLATIAPYNASFGRKFDELFHSATVEIKTFADALQEQGGSILGNVDGVDVTVEHVWAMEESQLLKIDYGVALEKFRRVSHLKKALERRPPMKHGIPGVRSVSLSSGAAVATAPERRVSIDVEAMRKAITAAQIAAEETKLRKIEESIRVFVRVADPKFRQVVPMRFFNLILTPAEAQAYCADYLEEKSIRAGIARTLLRIVAVVGRMSTELEEMKRQERSTSLWKLHAEFLIVLLGVAATLVHNAEHMLALASQHGTPEQSEAIKSSLDKLRQRSDEAQSTLTQASAR
jgi:hypothetical protein